MTEWITTSEAATLLGTSERAARKNASAGKYGEVKYEESKRGGGKSGKQLLINLYSLPLHLQVQYLRGYGREHEVEVSESMEWLKAPRWKRKIAGERMDILAKWDQYINAHPDEKKTDLTKEFVRTYKVLFKENNLSVSTLYRWKKAYNQEGGRDALLPGWGRKEKQADRSIPAGAWDLFLSLYGTTAQRPAADCYRDVALVSKSKGWVIPSLRTFLRKIEDVSESTWIMLREGEKEWLQQCGPYMMRDHSSITAGYMWVGDHQVMDLFVQGPNGKPVRPHLTAWIDIRSTIVVGWSISFQGNTDTVMASFAMGAMNKKVGLPSHILIDNGRDLTTDEFAGKGHRKKKEEKVDEPRVRSLVEELGIISHFAIPANAKSKTVERTFRIVSEQFSKRFPTYCGSDNKERPPELDATLKDPEKVPTIEEVREEFGGWWLNRYHNTPSEADERSGETPEETWNKHRGPIRRAKEEALLLCLMRHSQPLTVGRNGVKLFRAHYNNPDLQEYFGEKVYVRYRDEDMSKVHVFTLEDEYICDAKIVGKVPVVGVDKEAFREQNRIIKESKRVAKKYAETQDISEAEALVMAANKKTYGDKESGIQEPDVIELTRLHNMESAASAIEKRKAVGENQDSLKASFNQFLLNQRPSVKSEDKAEQAMASLKMLQRLQKNGGAKK